MQYQSEQTKQANLCTSKITTEFNAANLNFYNEESHTPQHSDDEPLFQTPHASPVKEKSIMSISVGATKIFAFRDKLTNEEIHLALRNGDVLFMEGTTQEYTTHQIFPNPTNPTQLPDLFDYPTMEELKAFGGKRMNITARQIHMHTAGCPLAPHNPPVASWSNDFPTTPLDIYLPNQATGPHPYAPPILPTADTVV